MRIKPDWRFLVITGTAFSILFFALAITSANAGHHVSALGFALAGAMNAHPIWKNRDAWMIP